MAANEQQRKVSGRAPRGRRGFFSAGGNGTGTARCRAARAPSIPRDGTCARDASLLCQESGSVRLFLAANVVDAISTGERREATEDEDGNDVGDVIRHVETGNGGSSGSRPPARARARTPHSRIIARLHSKIAQSAAVFTSASRAAVSARRTAR